MENKLNTVFVDKNFKEIFLKAQEVVNIFFEKREFLPHEGTINIADSRYILMRGDALASEFFMLIRKIYGDGNELLADTYTSSLLYELAYNIGKSDAKNFHSTMKLKTPFEKLSAGPIHFAYSGWSFVDIDKDSVATPDENFVLYYSHPYSFESYSWINNKKQALFPICCMNAGYSAGWCEESFGVHLVSKEISCKAFGDDECRFVMSMPDKLDENIDKYFKKHPSLKKKYDSFCKLKLDQEEIAGKKLENTVVLDYVHKLSNTERILQNKILELNNEIEKRNEIEKKLIYLTEIDHLTGLFAKRAFFEKVEKIINRINRTKFRSKKEDTYALFFVDIDNFKTINDTLGHIVGDAILREFAERLKKSNRTDNLIARVGGDEFLLWVPNIDHTYKISYIADNLVNLVNKPFLVDNKEVNVSISLGISIFPENGASLKELVCNADDAMYNAKRKGKNCYQYFDQEFSKNTEEKLYIKRELQKAILDDKIDVYYQPKMNIKTKKVVGIEALARWNHPIKGFIAPNIFIPLAEENNLISDLSFAVIKKSFKTFKKWIDLYPESDFDSILSVNLSAKLFVDHSFYTKIDELFKEIDLPQNRIGFEITETTIMNHLDVSLDIINSLKDKGIKVSMDDFGKGYSSLRSLKILPIDTVKIDTVFIKDMNTPKTFQNGLVITDIVNLIKSLGFFTLIERVESKKELDSVKDIDFDFVQGDYFSKAVSASEYEKKYIQNSFEIDNQTDLVC
jgi:polar amino acid transport system substrate-binding protein